MKIGVDVGGTHIGIGIIDDNINLIAKQEKDYEHKEKNMTNIVRELIVSGIEEILKVNNIAISQIESIGLAFPGTVSNGVVVKAENLGIENLDIKSAIKEKIDVPIKLENDAKCAAIAEKVKGSLKECDDAIFITIGTGIGGAGFIGGKLLKPKRFSGFELGHMVIRTGGNHCNCGRNGCFEAYGSMHTFKQRIRDEFNMPKAKGKEIKEFIKNNSDNEKLNLIIDEYLENVSVGITNLINIFEPQIISIGGGFGHYEDIFLERLREKIASTGGLYNKYDLPKIVIAELKNDAGIIGAAML